jgi:curved DNA-binding protein CbpA
MFVDYYEALEVSPNANPVTIDCVFRYLAKHFHPDNPGAGDAKRYSEIVEAHNVLKDPVKRAQYDIEYARHSEFYRRLNKEAREGDGLDQDADVQDRLLTLLYVRRRRSANESGMGEFELTHLLDCSPEYLEFHVWYLREKGWIRRNDSGFLAITVEGVDRVMQRQHRDAPKLLSEK